MAKKKEAVKITRSKSDEPGTAMTAAGSDLAHEIEQAFHRMFDRWPMFGRRWHLADFDPFTRMEFPSLATRQISLPRVDMAETDAAYELTAELPGLTGDDVECSLSGSTLTVKGQRKEEKEEKKKGYYLKERRSGSFERRLTVPDDVDVDKLEASVVNGVLKVVLPKKAEAKKKARRIEVKNG